jgi:MATE family multidrug resistance protein
MSPSPLPFSAELRALWTLAWPAVLGQLGWMAMGVTDVIMVGDLGEVPLAAVTAGHIWSFGVIIFAMGVLSGLDPFFAQSHGAGDHRAQGHALARSILLALLLSIPATLLHYIAGPALQMLGQPAEIIASSAAYCKAMAWGCPAILVFSALRQFLQGGGWMRAPMVAVWVANLANIGLNALLIYGLWGFPAMGVEGCGWSTAIVRVLMIFLLLGLARKNLFGRPWPSLPELRDLSELKRLLKIGGPVGIHFGLEVWAFNLVGLMMGVLGTRELAANSVVMNLISVTFMIPFGISAAAATRVGQLVGAEEPWGRAAWTAVGMGGSFMAMMGVVLLLFPEPLMRLYIDDDSVIRMGMLIVPMAAAFQLFDGIQAVSVGALRGAGDTFAPALVNLAGFWALGLPVAWGLGIEGWGLAEPLGPGGVWWGLVVGLVFVAVAQSCRLVYVIRRGAIRVLQSA